TFRMLLHMLSHEGAHTFIEPFANSGSARLTLGIKGVRISEVLEQILHLINRYNFDVVRSFVIQFEEGFVEPINVMHFIMRHTSGEKIDAGNLAVIKLINALRTLGWVDSDDYNEFTREPYSLSINAANLLRSMAAWVHILLGKENAYYYSEHK